MKVKYIYDLCTIPILIFGGLYMIFGAISNDIFLFVEGVSGLLMAGIICIGVKFLTLKNFITTKYPEYSQHNEMDFGKMEKEYMRLKKELKK